MPQLSNADVDYLNAFLGALRNARGPVRFDGKTLTFLSQSLPQATEVRREGDGVRVVPTSYAGGAGKYIGRLAVNAASAIDPAADLSEADLGTAGSGAVILIVNGAEIGDDAGHDLTLNKAYPGAVACGTDSSGRTVYHGHWLELCDPEEGG